ncbi:MAG: hypothetical protein ABI318_12775 [Chthoniobacteraceae bacterium]
MTLPLSPELKEIADKLNDPHPRVVIVVGTGVAINATGQHHAHWQGLLEHGVEHLMQTGQLTRTAADDRLKKLKAAFDPFQLQGALAAAEDIEHNLKYPNEAAFASWLESAFANFKTRDVEKAKAPLEALRDLHQAGALLLTTNYDSLLSDMMPDMHPVTWEEHDVSTA